MRTSRKKEFEQRIERAKSWLKSAKPESPAELAFQLLGLGWAGEKPHFIEPFTRAILAAQRSDGGWASLPNLESDAWMTGSNLVALHQAGGVKVGDRAYQRGVDILLRTQFDNGSWWVRSRTLPALHLEMPPLAKRPKYPPLTGDQIQKLSLWIEQGSPE